MGGKRSDATTLLWQSQMGRTPTHKVVASVDRYAALSRGFLGLGRSPSYGGPAGFYNAMELQGTVVSADQGFTPPAIKLVVPGRAVPALERGMRVVLAVVEGNICIGLAPVPASIQGDSALEAWRVAWTLPKEPEISDL